MSVQTVAVPDVPLILEVLIDPLLRQGPALATMLAQAGSGRRAFRPQVIVPVDRGALLDAVGPGSLAVLADPHPAVVAVLVRWEVLVVAVNTTGARSRQWRDEVLSQGAVAALVQPQRDRLLDAVAALV